MTKLATGILVGFGAALVGWWISSRRESELENAAGHGEVIFRNTPVAD